MCCFASLWEPILGELSIHESRASLLWMLCRSWVLTALHCLSSFSMAPQAQIPYVNDKVQVIKDFFLSWFSPVWW